MLRWVCYVLLGVFAGICAWITADLPWDLAEAWGEGTWIARQIDRSLAPAWVLVLWVAPAVAGAVVEARRTGRVVPAAAAPSCFWWGESVGYFAAYAGKLLLGLGGDQLPVRLDRGWTVYRGDVAALQPVLETLGFDFILWTTVGLIGGACLGGAMGLLAWLVRGARPGGDTDVLAGGARSR